MATGADGPHSPRPKNAPPWEEARGNEPAPWEKPEQPSAPTWQQPAAPPASGGFRLFPQTRGRQIAVIVFLVLFFIVAPLCTWLASASHGRDKAREEMRAEDARQQLSLQQREEAERLMQQAVVFLRSQYPDRNLTEAHVLEKFQDECHHGKYQTEHYEIQQATLTRRVGPKAFNVVLVCNPKSSAADKVLAGYIQFRWADAETQMEWR
jgi:hypothetical protein